MIGRKVQDESWIFWACFPDFCKNFKCVHLKTLIWSTFQKTPKHTFAKIQIQSDINSLFIYFSVFKITLIVWHEGWEDFLGQFFSTSWARWDFTEVEAERRNRCPFGWSVWLWTRQSCQRGWDGRRRSQMNIPELSGTWVLLPTLTLGVAGFVPGYDTQRCSIFSETVTHVAWKRPLTVDTLQTLTTESPARQEIWKLITAVLLPVPSCSVWYVDVVTTSPSWLYLISNLQNIYIWWT